MNDPFPMWEKPIAGENEIRELLRNFGVKVDIVGMIKFEERIRDLVAGIPDLVEIMASLLDARRGVPATDDEPGCPPNRVTSFYCDHRHSGAV